MADLHPLPQDAIGTTSTLTEEVIEIVDRQKTRREIPGATANIEIATITSSVG